MSPGRGAALAAASGVLLAASLSGPPRGLLALVALAPLLLALDRAPARAAALRGALALGLAALLAVRFAWAPLRSQLSPPLALLVLLVLASGQALGGALVGALTALGRERLSFPVAFLAAHLLVEQALPTPLPWSLALAVTDHPALVQAAALGGAPLVAVLVAGASLAAAWPAARALGRRWPARWALAPLGGLALAALLGSARLRALDAAGGEVLAVGLVHGDVALTGRPPVEGLAELRRAHDEAERGGAQLVVWPETALPFALRPEALDDDLRAQLDPPPRVPTALGALLEGPGGATNSALLIEGGRVVGRHDKRVLLPFGEYVPLADRLPWLDALSPLSPRAPALPGGDGPTGLAGRRVACQICYEGVVSGVSADEVHRQGASLVLDLANDAWFDGTDEPALHLAASRLRAVELGRPWLRATNRGVSAVIDPAGRLLAAATGGPTRAVQARLRLVAWPTPFERSGPLGAWFALGLVLFALRARTTTPL